jgi:uncharacterized protein involved in exopolysaccharide biosynthesis
MVPPGTSGPPPEDSAVQQLEAAVAQRRTLLGRYTVDHPDVIALNRRIDTLEARVRQEASVRPAPDGARAKPLTAAEILRRNRLRDLQANLEDVDRQIAAKQANEQRLRDVIAEYQAKVDATPTRQTELIELTRDYTTLQGIYTDLLGKREASKLAAKVEQQQIGEQYKVLDPARIPERPFSPDRFRILVMGAGLGLGLGLALIALLEYRDVTFKTEEDVRRVLDLPVLALVPMMASERELRSRRRRKLLAALAVVVMVVGSAAALAIWKLQGS